MGESQTVPTDGTCSDLFHGDQFTDEGVVCSVCGLPRVRRPARVSDLSPELRDAARIALDLRAHEPAEVSISINGVSLATLTSPFDEQPPRWPAASARRSRRRGAR